MTKQMPQLNAKYFGSRAAKLRQPLDQAELEFRRDKNPTPYQVGQFRWGYAAGLVAHRLDYLMSTVKYCTRDELAELLEDIEPIADDWGYTSLYDEIDKPQT